MPLATAHQLLSIQNLMRSWQFPSQSKNPVTFVTPNIHYSPPLVPTPSHINSGHRFISTVPSQETPALQAIFVLEIFPPNFCNYFSYVPAQCYECLALWQRTSSRADGRRYIDSGSTKTNTLYKLEYVIDGPQLPVSPSMKLRFKYQLLSRAEGFETVNTMYTSMPAGLGALYGRECI